MMRAALVTAWDELYDPIADVTTPIMHRYCLQHDYVFLPSRGKFHLDPERDPSFLTYGDRAKLTIYESLYELDYDLVVWMDVDTLITNPKILLEDIIGTRPFLWTYGPSGPLSGFTMARTLPEVHCFLHHVKHLAADMRSEHDPTGWSDQNTMRHLMNLPPYDAVAQNIVSCKEAGHCMPVEPYGWEKYRRMVEWEHGDFLYTVPSIPLDERLDMLGIKRQLIYGE